MYSSILSVPVSNAASIIEMSGSTKIEVRIPSIFSLSITPFKNLACFLVFHPALDVIASSASGTNVTWVGFTSHTRFKNFVVGLPSILNSVLTTLGKFLASS